MVRPGGSPVGWRRCRTSRASRPPPAWRAPRGSAGSSPASPRAGSARARRTSCARPSAPTRRPASGPRRSRASSSSSSARCAGAAMKVGQVLSTIDFTALPEEERESFKQTLAQLRDDVPPLPFQRLEKLLREELGEKPSAIFAEFDEDAFAAASIGQVHRAVTRDGDAVAVKVQYPGVAEAVETDLRNLTLLLPLVKRLAPGLDVKALYAELRERIAEELDYELEAQNQRAVARAHRGHPFAHRARGPHTRSPAAACSSPTCSRARASRRSSARDEADPRPLRRDRLPLLLRPRAVHRPGVAATRTRATTCCSTTAASASSTSGSCACSTAAPGARGRVAVAVEAGDADARARGAVRRSATCPSPDDVRARGAARRRSRAMGAWYLEPGERRFTPAYVSELLDATSGPRSPWFEQMRRQTLPPQALLLRRMEGLVFSTLGEVRAAADWNAIAREYYADAPPSTPLGEAEARSGRRAARASRAPPRATRRSAGSGGRAWPPPRRACPSRRRGRGTGRRGARRPAPSAARSPPASASGSRSSRARWGRRSCATTSSLGRLPRSRCSGVTRPGRHVGLAVDGVGVEEVARRGPRRRRGSCRAWRASGGAAWRRSRRPR